MDDTSDIELQLEREAGAAEHVAGLLVGFGMAMALDPKATKENGGQEVYTERLFLRICIPGNKNYEWCQPATEADKLRWPESWRRYCNKAAATGTPLENLPGMSRSITKVLRKRGITSVETLAAVSDTNLGGLGLLGNTAREWRDTARRQLSGAQAAASAQANADEKAALEKQLKEMTERMAQMEAMLSATSPARRRNGAKPVLLPAEAIEDGEPAHV